MPTHTIERDGRIFTAGIQLYGASDCEVAKRQGLVRNCRLTLDLGADLSPVAQDRVRVYEDVDIDFGQDDDALERDLDGHVERLAKRLLDEAECIRQARALEANARSRLDSIFAKPRS